MTNACPARSIAVCALHSPGPSSGSISVKLTRPHRTGSDAAFRHELARTRQRLSSAVGPRRQCWPINSTAERSNGLHAQGSSPRAALTVGTSRAVAVAMPPPNSASRFVAVAGAGRMMSTDELRRLTRRIVDSEGAAAVSLSAPAARRTTTRLASLRPLPCASASLSLTLRRLQALA